MRGIIFFLIVLAYSVSVCCDDKGNDDILEKLTSLIQTPERNLTIRESWENFENVLKDFTNAAVKSFFPILMDSFLGMNISKECIQNTMHIVLGLKSLRPNAMRFLDASGKMMDGIMVGSPTAFGAYDECLNTEVRSTRLRDKGQMMYRGQYCIINVMPPLPPKSNFYKVDDVLEELQSIARRDTVVGEIARNAKMFYFINLRFGLCTPTGCSLEDINKVAKSFGNIMSLNATAARCEVKEENEYTPLMITFISCLGVLFMLVLVATLIDLYVYYRKAVFKSTMVRVLLAFSFFTNFRKFVNTDTASDTLSCLNGIRFLCMTWVILGHTYLTVNFQMFIDLMKVREYAKNFFFQTIVNGSVAVDTFYCMGGLLVCYLTIKLVRNEGRKLNVGFYIFHRLWRIYPVYIFTIISVFFANLVGSGPLWHEHTNNHVKACYDNWWTNLLFINNFYDSEHMCIPHSWYISSDFQLYIGALIILLPMIRWPKAGIGLSVLAIIACILYSGIGTYIHDYPPAMLFAHPDPVQRLHYWAHFYFRPFVHIGPYCVGLLAGYLLATKPALKISPIIQVAGWCVAFCCNMSVLYGVLEWNKGVEPTLFASIMYASFNRTAWSLGVVWVIICCSTGHGGVVNYILSWKVFVPLGRLTYVAFLIHPLVQIVVIANIRSQMQPDHFVAVWIYFGHLCVIYGVSFLASMFVEAPFMAMEKIFFFKHQRKQESSSMDKEMNNIRGDLKTDKNGDIAAIVTKIDEESGGIDNRTIIYRL